MGNDGTKNEIVNVPTAGRPHLVPFRTVGENVDVGVNVGVDEYVGADVDA